jgi:hypothetical protein
VSPRLDNELEEDTEATTDDELLDLEELLELVATDEELRLDEVFDELELDTEDATPLALVYCSIQS